MNVDLEQFLHGSHWQNRFEEEICLAGKSISAKVRGVKILEEAESLLFQAEIQGEVCEVSAWKNLEQWDIDSTCSCETNHYCVHACALLQYVQKQARPTRLLGKSVHEAIEASLSTKLQATPAVKIESEPTAPKKMVSLTPHFSLHIKREKADQRMKLLLKALGQAEVEQWVCATALAHYGEYSVTLRSAFPTWESEIHLKNGDAAQLKHHAPAENLAVQQLRDTGLSSILTNDAWKFMLQTRSRRLSEEKIQDRWFCDPRRIDAEAFWVQFRGEMIKKLIAQGWLVTVDDFVGHDVIESDPDEWMTELSATDGHWFSLSVGFDVDGKRFDLLPILAKLIESDFMEETLDRPHNGFVYASLPNGKALRLPIGRVRNILRQLAAFIDPKFPERTKIHQLDAVGLSEIQGLNIAVPPELGELRAKLLDFSGMKKVLAPDGLKATMRDYQLDGFRWMQFLARHGLHGILADDMGLGKTLQSIAHILAEKKSGYSQGLATLVIAPTSVVPNWLAEIKKFAPELTVLILQGADRKGYFCSIPHADVVITSYALLQRDVERFSPHEFHLMILDEAQYIKNPKSKVAQAASKIRSRHRLSLSGTPIENHLGELWSQFRFLIPHFLGTKQQFNEQFRQPIEKNGDAEKNAALKARIAPLILRRTKDQVAKELPPKTELVHLIELSTPQKDLYETIRASMDKRVRQAIAARGIEQSTIVFLDALLKLRQICCDPRLLPSDLALPDVSSAKLDFLMELLTILLEEGRRILIFSQFTTMLGLIEQELIERKILHLKLTGASKNRGQLVEEFQSGKASVFLISLKAGGTGLNLTAADTVIHFDPWWNPASEAQATDRAYRIGQDKPVFVHKLLCQETVEERIHKMQRDKAHLADGILADADVVKKLDANLVRSLLEPMSGDLN